MFFLLSKTLHFLIDPVTWIATALCVGLALNCVGRNQGARYTLVAAIGLVVIIGWQPTSEVSLRRLENKVDVDPINFNDYDGLIVLGGAIDGTNGLAVHTDVPLNGNVERLTRAVALLRRYPHLKVVYSGNSGLLFHQPVPEATLAGWFFDDQGIPRDRVILETHSRNTFENAAECAKRINDSNRWILITSAYHMNRSMIAFKRLDLCPQPFPVDYRTDDTIDWKSFDFFDGYARWKLVLHEWIGTGVYAMVGHPRKT